MLMYPASCTTVMSVAAVDANKRKASFSNFNSAVDIAAPGVDVMSTLPVRSGSGSGFTSSGQPEVADKVCSKCVPEWY